MQTYDSQPQETLGDDSGASQRKDDKPARIVAEGADGEPAHYDVEHYVKNDGWVSLWTSRDGSGIDVQLPRSRVIGILRGREHHQSGVSFTDSAGHLTRTPDEPDTSDAELPDGDWDGESDDDDERELITDGGRTVNDIPWMLAEQSQYVEDGQVTVSGSTVTVQVTGDRSVVLDASRAPVQEVVNTLARAVSRAFWEEYDDDEEVSADGE